MVSYLESISDLSNRGLYGPRYAKSYVYRDLCNRVLIAIRDIQNRYKYAQYAQWGLDPARVVSYLESISDLSNRGLYGPRYAKSYVYRDLYNRVSIATCEISIAICDRDVYNHVFGTNMRNMRIGVSTPVSRSRSRARFRKRENATDRGVALS